MLDNITIENLESLIKKGRKVTKKDLLALPAIYDNPISVFLMDRYTKIDPRDPTHKFIDFRNMITDLNLFVSGKDLDSKLKFLFSLYDTDNNGLISNHELYLMLEKLSDNSIEGPKIQNIVDQTFREIKATAINFEDFKKIVKKRTKNIEAFFFVGSTKIKKSK